MPDPVDNSIALQFKPTQQLDLTGVANSLANLDMAGAHSALYGQQAKLQGMRINALGQWSDALARGEQPEQAVRFLNAVDPAMGEQALKNIQLGTQLGANRGYAAGNVNALQAAGPEAYGAGVTAQKTAMQVGANQAFAATGDPTTQRAAGPEAFGAAVTAQKGQTDLWGQAGNAILSGVRPDGTLDPTAKATAFGLAKQAGATPLQIAQYAEAPDAHLIQIGKALTAGGQTAAGYASTSGAAAGNEAAAKAPYEHVTTTPGEALYGGAGFVSAMGAGSQAAQGGPQPQGAPQGGAPSGGYPPGTQWINGTPTLNGRSLLPMPQVGGGAPQAGGSGAAPVTSGQGRGVPNLPIFAQTDQQNGLPAGYMHGVVSIENPKMDPNAFNATSHAAGFAQFVPSTWKQYGNGKSVFDPAANLDAAGRLAADNQATFAKTLGRQPTASELYLSHQQGIGGAISLLQNPDMPAAQALLKAGVSSARAAQSIRQNGGDPNAPAAAFTGMWDAKFNTVAGGPSTVPFGGRALVMPTQGGAQPQPQGPGQAPIVPVPGQPGAAVGALMGAGAPIAPAPTPLPVPAPVMAPARPAPVQPMPLAAPVAPAPAPGISTGNGAPPMVAPQQPGGIRPIVPGMSIAEKAAAEATGKGMADAQVKQFSDAKEGYGQANTAQLSINQLQKDLSNIPTSGLLTPGSGAVERLGLAKAINTSLTSFGMAPAFPPSDVAAAEGAQKITGKLGVDMSRTLGSREAAQIVHLTIGLNPGIASTPEGARLVASSINAGLQRQKDFYQFLSQNGNAPDADIKFNQTHPVAQYAQEAQALAKIPQKAVDMLQKNVSSPTLSAYFDKNYGAGLSRYYTGQ